MIAWANYAGDISKLCLRVVAIKAWRATKNKFQGWWSVHLGLKLHWFIRILYGAEFLTIFFKKLSRVLLGDCGKKSRQTDLQNDACNRLVPRQYVFMFSLQGVVAPVCSQFPWNRNSSLGVFQWRWKRVILDQNYHILFFLNVYNYHWFCCRQ